jgi:2-dehydro-3-deoxyphosphogalactonate aldolase
MTTMPFPLPYHPAPAFTAAFAQCPMVAILRGVPTADAVAVARQLYAAGFRLIEVPLNSPSPLDSIAAICEALPGDAVVGAGTVLTPALVGEVRQAGGSLIVMPHGDPSVISAAKDMEMICLPGVATPTEAFAALRAGADALKMFPAEQLGTNVVKAWRAVIPPLVPLLPVGGVTPDNVGAFVKAGASGFGLGSALYTPGRSAADTGAIAVRFVQAMTDAARA